MRDAVASVSDTIRERLKAGGVRMFANDTIGHHLAEGEVDLLQQELEQVVGTMLDALLIDRHADHNTVGTAARVARMMFREVFAGRYQAPPPCTDFPNEKKLDELYTVGPLRVRSACAHHLCPIEGNVWFGVIPGERVIGLSKFARIAEWVLARPQIQEEAIVQLADELEQRIKPKGLAVMMEAKHSCMTWRGVREADSNMVTSVMRGIFREAPAARSEFLTFVNRGRQTCL